MKMKDSGIEWIGKIPNDWDQKRIKYLYLTNKAKLPKEFSEDKNLIPYLSMDFIRDVSIRPIYAKDGDFCSKDDILLLWDGANAGEIIFEHPEGYAPSTSAILRKISKETEAVFDKYYLKAFEDELRKKTNGMGIPHVDGYFFRNSMFLIPPMNKQVNIANYLDSKCSKIDEVIQTQEQIIEKLKDYKQALITETVTKGLDKSKAIKNSGYDFIGKIPESWKVCRLRNIGTPQNGISKGGEFFGHGFPFVTYRDVYKNFSIPEVASGLIESTKKEQEQYSVQEGDIFFTRTSETIDEVGFASVCEKTIPNATFAGFLIRVRPFTDDLITSFAKYYFRSQHHRFYLVKEMNLVTRASLGQDLLKSMPVLVPPKEEQQKIAAYLDVKCKAIDDSIEKKQQIIERLAEYKKSLIYECVTGKKEV